VADHAIDALATLPGIARVWAVGERVRAWVADAGLAVAGLFTVPASVDGIAPLIGEILMQSETGDRDVGNRALYLFYNRPALGAAYAPITQRLLPLDQTWRRSLADRPWPTKSLPEVMGRGSATLSALIHEHLFVSLFRACAESLASENASRLAAMERADRNIDELLGNLNSKFHRLRQSGIDEELFDVIGGYEALTKGRAPRPRAVA
jgi:F-type H+-transporting ATPase subunit gamma